MNCDSRNAGWGRIESGRSIRQGKRRLVSDRLEGILEGVVSLATARHDVRCYKRSPFEKMWGSAALATQTPRRQDPTKEIEEMAA